MSFKFSKRDQAIQFGRVDERIFNGVADEAPVIGETIDQLSREPEGGKGKYLNRSHVTAIQFDTFNALSKHSPKRNDEGGDKLVNEILDRIQRDEQYHELRSYTVGDDLSAALGSCGLVDHVVTNLPEDVTDAANDQRQAEQEAQEAEADLAAHQDEDGNPSDDVDDDEYDELREFAAKKRDDADKAAKRVEANLKAHGKSIGKAVSSAMGKATKEAGAMNAASNAFGLNDAQVGGGLPMEEKFRIAKALQNSGEKFRKLIDLIGKARQSAERKNAEKMQHEGGEIVDLTEGDDFGLIVDDEIALLRNPTLGLMQRARLLDQELTQFEVETKEPQDKGDIIALVDESASMRGQRDAEAKAVVLALAHIALRQKRRVRVMFFQTSITETFDIDGTADAIDAGLRNLSAIASRGTGGGTNFDRPMRDAMNSTRDLSKPDVLIITDGEATISDATLKIVNERKANDGMNVYAMLIDAHGRNKEEVSKFADRTWDCDSLLGTASEELFGAVV